MTPLVFPHFREIPPIAGTNYLDKWKTLHGFLTVPQTFAGPLSLHHDDVQRWNRDTNMSIAYTKDVDDVWQAPGVTIRDRRGDCEDYAILKYAALMSRAGLTEDYLRLVIGRIAAMPNAIGHAWCAAYLDDAWWVLDNKFHQLIHPDEYINWWPAVALWSDQVTFYSHIVVLNRELQV